MSIEDSKKIAVEMNNSEFKSLSIERQLTIRRMCINGRISTIDEYKKELLK